MPPTRKLLLATLIVAAACLFAPAIKAETITFAPLGGPNQSPYVGHTEVGFNVTPVGGAWFQGQVFGNPVPSIFAGPVGSPTISSIQIVRTSAGLFTFGALDYSSNNGNSTFLIQGFLGVNTVFTQTGTLSGPGGVFSTLLSAFPNVQMDRFFFQVTPGSGVTSINIDNIVVNSTAVPEPATLLLLGTGLAGALGAAHRRRKAQASQP
jgi:hypothetical protein